MKTFKLLLFVYSTHKHLLVSSFGTAIIICFICNFFALFFCKIVLLQRLDFYPWGKYSKDTWNHIQVVWKIFNYLFLWFLLSRNWKCLVLQGGIKNF